MAQAFLEFEGAPLLFDCVTSEVTEHTAEVTEHPVEEGSDVADHVRNKNDEISLEIFVSNTPVSDVNGLYNGQVAGLELKVPRYERPLSPTPGSLMTAGINAIGNLLNPPAALSAIVLQFPEKFNNVAFILGTLLDYKERAVLGKVITPHRTYPNVVITRVGMSRTGATGDGAPLNVEFKTIRIVEAKLITAPIPTEVSGKIMKPKGRQPVSFVRDPAPKQSLLKKLLG